MASRRTPTESRHGVTLSSLDDELFEGAGVTKRALVDYLDGIADRLVPQLHDRPLSVIRVGHGQDAFMQKNLPHHAPEWIVRLPMWAETSQREVSYPLCNDTRTLVWFANQRAVEYHPTLSRLPQLDAATHVVIDLDPPLGAPFATVVRTARLVRSVLDELGLPSVVKTSGAKGLHVMIPVGEMAPEDAAAATRAIAARAERLDPGLATTAFLKEDRAGRVFLDATRTAMTTLAAVYSPRARPGVPVSFPVAWGDLDAVEPGSVTVTNALGLLGGSDPWAEGMPPAQTVPPELIVEGHTIAIPRVAAMHEGRRRRAAQRRRDEPGTT